MNEQRTYEEQVTMHLGLVGVVLKNIVKNNQDWEDMFQIGSIGLMKAAMRYDESKNTKFSSYAMQCIQNEVLMEIRKQHVKCRNAQVISFNSPLKKNNDDGKLVIGDLISDPKQNIEAQKEQNDLLRQALEYVINILESRERYVILCRAGGMLQKEIADNLGISQSFISRIEINATKKLNRVLEKDINTGGSYKVKVKNGEIKITFNGTKKIMHNILCNVDFDLNAKKFWIEYNENELNIKVPADEESLPFIAKVIETIEKASK